MLMYRWLNWVDPTDRHSQSCFAKTEKADQQHEPLKTVDPELDPPGFGVGISTYEVRW